MADTVKVALKTVTKPFKPRSLQRKSSWYSYIKHSVLCDALSFLKEIEDECELDEDDLASDEFYDFQKCVLKRKHKLSTVLNVLYIIALVMLWFAVIISTISKAFDAFGKKMPEVAGGVVVGLSAIGAPLVPVFGFLKGQMAEDENSSKIVCLSLLLSRRNVKQVTDRMDKHDKYVDDAIFRTSASRGDEAAGGRGGSIVPHSYSTDTRDDELHANASLRRIASTPPPQPSPNATKKEEKGELEEPLVTTQGQLESTPQRSNPTSTAATTTSTKKIDGNVAAVSSTSSKGPYTSITNSSGAYQPPQAQTPLNREMTTPRAPPPSPATPPFGTSNTYNSNAPTLLPSLSSIPSDSGSSDAAFRSCESTPNSLPQFRSCESTPQTVTPQLLQQPFPWRQQQQPNRSTTTTTATTTKPAFPSS